MGRWQKVVTEGAYMEVEAQMADCLEDQIAGCFDQIVDYLDHVADRYRHWQFVGKHFEN